MLNIEEEKNNSGKHFIEYFLTAEMGYFVIFF